MSDQILLVGIHGFGYHGLFEHERSNGQDFYVDLALEVDLEAASRTDSIQDTVNYGEITDLVVAQIRRYADTQIGVPALSPLMHASSLK